MNLVNLGCGARFAKSWINIDFTSSDEGVRQYNLLKGIPLPDNFADLVYHSHLFEHFSRRSGAFFLKECGRVLKPGGIIRVVVPDLEKIAKEYLKSLEAARTGSERGRLRYEWMIIELLDQMVREKSGGEMLEYLRSESIPEKEFVLQRLGAEARKIINGRDGVQAINPSKIDRFLRVLRGFLFSAEKRRAYLSRVLLGDSSLEFLRSGEAHKWMYDGYSLRTALESANFVDVVQRAAAESYIPEWETYHLDTEPDGSVYKPDSLYMEARKKI